MLTIDRWRKWRPSDEKFEESPGCEPPKPSEPTFEGFEGSTSGQMQNFSDAPPELGPAEWRAPFAQWLDSVCARHPRTFGGVPALHLAFCEWEIARQGVPCTRETFELLLREMGFLIGEVAGLVLVSGLTFREDVKAAGL
jgi:hypothetical protein